MNPFILAIGACACLLTACGQPQAPGRSFEQITIATEPALLRVVYDSLQLEAAKGSTPESQEQFYSTADDVTYYDGLITERMDSLRIPVVQSDKDSILVNWPGGSLTIVKDSTFSIFEYFYFHDGTVKRADVFEMAGI